MGHIGRRPFHECDRCLFGWVGHWTAGGRQDAGADGVGHARLRSHGGLWWPERAHHDLVAALLRRSPPGSPARHARPHQRPPHDPRPLTHFPGTFLFDEFAVFSAHGEWSGSTELAWMAVI